MKLKSHIKIALNTLEDIQKEVNWEINKAAYIFGSIAPDLNTAIPTHNIKHTIERFKKKIRRVEKYNPGIIQSFTLGVIMHYICDYFTYAHNRKIEVGHAIYEINLQKHLDEQFKMLNNREVEVGGEWEDIYGHIKDAIDTDSEIEDTIKSTSHHINKIVYQVIEMNRIYLNEIEKVETNGEWKNNYNIIEIDSEISRLMCKNIALEILIMVR